MPKKEIKDYTKQSKIITIISIIIPLLIIGILVFNYSYSSNIQSKVVLDGLELSDISLENNNGTTKYTATVTATKDINVNYINITINDDTLIGYIGKTLVNGDTTKISATIDKEISDISNINYEIK